MSDADIVDVDVTEFVDGTIVYKGSQPLSQDAEDVEPIHGDSFQCLGVYSACAAKDAEGHCEVVKLGQVGGLNDVCIGARDTRVGPKLGRMDPGDTILISTDPKTDVQVRCHGKRKQLVLFARKGDATSEQALIMLDANKEKFQFIGFGGTLEFSKKNGWIMRDASGQGFHINNGICTWNVTSHYLCQTAALPVRVGIAAIGGAPSPSVYAMVGHLWSWFKLWLWARMPSLPESETASG